MENRLVWTKKGPFIEIVLLNVAYDHNFPKPHKDCLEYFVAFDVPVEKVGELAKFDGSIIVDRTRGTLSARCDSEAHNLVALNLADKIIKASWTSRRRGRCTPKAPSRRCRARCPRWRRS